MIDRFLSHVSVRAVFDFLNDRVGNHVHWINATFTGCVAFLSPQIVIDSLAFLFVSVPLGVFQWFRLIDFLKDRAAKQNARKHVGS